MSLVPHATELLFALGLGDDVVGVTHECDYPPRARELPQVTSDELPPGLSSAEIDAAVRERTERGDSIYRLDEQTLQELEPDLIVTQELCPVCAVSYDEVQAIAKELPVCPQVVALDPRTFGETMGDVRTIAQATGALAAALDLIARQRARVDAIQEAVMDEPLVTVAALEWLDPVFVAGHWTPQLIELAGGIDVLGLPGEPSVQTTWEMVAAAGPRGRRRDALRVRRGALARGGGDPRRASCAGSGRSGSSPSTPLRPSRDRARDSSTGSRHSRTSCTRAPCRRRPAPVLDAALR